MHSLYLYDSRNKWDGPLRIVYRSREYDDGVLRQRIRQIYQIHLFVNERDKEIILKQSIHCGVPILAQMFSH